MTATTSTYRPAPTRAPGTLLPLHLWQILVALSRRGSADPVPAGMLTVAYPQIRYVDLETLRRADYLLLTDGGRPASPITSSVDPAATSGGWRRWLVDFTDLGRAVGLAEGRYAYLMRKIARPGQTGVLVTVLRRSARLSDDEVDVLIARNLVAAVSDDGDHQLGADWKTAISARLRATRLGAQFTDQFLN